MLADIRSGFTAVWATGWLRMCVVLSIGANVLCIAPLYVLLPRMVTSAGGDGRTLGLVIAVQAGFAALCSVLVGKFGRGLRDSVVVYLLVAVTGLGILLLGAASHLALIVAAMPVLGLGFAFNVVEMAMIQERVATQVLSRVYSVNMLASYVFAPIGYVASGYLAAGLSAGTVLVGGGAGLLALTGITALAQRGRLDDAAPSLHLEQVPETS